MCTYACKYASYNLMQVLLFTKNGDMKGKNKPVKAKPVVWSLEQKVEIFCKYFENCKIMVGIVCFNVTIG